MTVNRTQDVTYKSEMEMMTSLKLLRNLIGEKKSKKKCHINFLSYCFFLPIRALQLEYRAQHQKKLKGIRTAETYQTRKHACEDITKLDKRC